MNVKQEENIIIAIEALKKVMNIFLGPFLVTYFIKTSAESLFDLSIYYIFSYILLTIGTFIVASITKNKLKLNTFCFGVTTNFIYILLIIILREKIVDYLAIVSILYGISASTYFFPYNIFVINKVDNSNRTSYTVKSKIISSIIGVVCPIILGTVITITNYQFTAIFILIISLIQIILSFKLKPMEDTNLSNYNLKNTWNKIKQNKHIKNMLIVEYFTGMNEGGALETVITILIFNSFKTDINLGLISSISTIFSIFCFHWYKNKYKQKEDKQSIKFCSIIPVLTLLILLIWTNNLTIIIYNFCYVALVGILDIARRIRLFNIANSYIVAQENQAEFFSLREGILNAGRVTGYFILLITAIIGNILSLNISMIILTLSILIMGMYIQRIDKFEKIDI